MASNAKLTALFLALLVAFASADLSARRSLRLDDAPARSAERGAAARDVMGTRPRGRALIESPWNMARDYDRVASFLFDADNVDCNMVANQVWEGYCQMQVFRMVCGESCAPYADPVSGCEDHDEVLAELLDLIEAPKEMARECGGLVEAEPEACMDPAFGLACASSCEVDCRFWPAETEIPVFIPECGKTVEIPMSAMKMFGTPEFTALSGEKDCSF